jgi:glycerol-3-phosphate acyltransferase PlsY
MPPIGALAIGYLAGSIPFAYLAGRMLKGIDLRTDGRHLSSVRSSVSG